MSYQILETHYCFQGSQSVYSHWSEATNTKMNFALYLPPNAQKTKVPVLYWLSGLTCTEQNFITKAGAQRIAALLGLALVVPDTSPRGVSAHCNQDNLGEGASFYLNATQEPWAAHFQMYTYLSQELPHFISTHFPVDKRRCGLLGHSMGGHGALVIGLSNPQLFSSISAFAPIASITQSPWGINALTHYLGTDKHTWNNYDACFLLEQKQWPHGEILIDQGVADPYLEEQLKVNLLVSSAAKTNTKLTVRLQQHYDHSYYFVSTFIEEHMRFHAKKWT